MAASVRVEDEAFSDIRYDVLATACHLADADHARGKMLNLWRQCTAQHRHVLPRSMVVAVLGQSGPMGIVEAGLGEEHPEGIRIKGTEGRIEWLAKLRENAAKGGAAKAAKRLPIGSPDGSQEASQTAAIRGANRVPPPCPPVPVPTTDPVSSPSESKRASPPAPQTSLGLTVIKAKLDAATGPHHAAIAEFTGYYQRAHSGASPTWNGKTTKLIGGLVKAHGLHEITRRIAALEASPPTWPPGPWDLATFVQHFDKLAAPASVRAASPTTGRAEPQRPEDYEADRGRAF